MRNRLVIGIALLLSSALSFASAPRIISVDVFKSADGTKTWNLPPTSDTLFGTLGGALTGFIDVTNASVNGVPSPSTTISTNDINTKGLVIKSANYSASVPPAGLVFDAEYATIWNPDLTISFDASFVPPGGSLTGHGFGGAEVHEDGTLDLTGGGVKYVSYSAVNSAALAVNKGTVRFTLTPNGSFSGVQVFYTAGETLGNHSTIQIYKDMTGKLCDFILDSTESVIDNSCATVGFSIGVPTEIELDYNLDSGDVDHAITMFQDGGTVFTNTNTGVQSASDVTNVILGKDNTSDTNADFFIENVVVYSNVQHTADYTAPIAKLGLSTSTQISNIFEAKNGSGDLLSSVDNSGSLSASSINNASLTLTPFTFVAGGGTVFVGSGKICSPGIGDIILQNEPIYFYGHNLPSPLIAGVKYYSVPGGPGGCGPGGRIFVGETFNGDPLTFTTTGSGLVSIEYPVYSPIGFKADMIPNKDSIYSLGSVDHQFLNLYAGTWSYNSNQIDMSGGSTNVRGGQLQVFTSVIFGTDNIISNPFIFKIIATSNQTTNDLTSWYKPGGGDDSDRMARIDFAGGLILSPLEDHIPMSIKAFSGQTVDLSQWKNSSDAVLTKVDASGNVAVNKLGSGFQVKVGSNGRAGRDTLVGGTVTVANTSVSANTDVHYWISTPGGVQGFLSASKINGTSFTITSTSILETSSITWELLEEIP